MNFKNKKVDKKRIAHIFLQKIDIFGLELTDNLNTGESCCNIWLQTEQQYNLQSPVQNETEGTCCSNIIKDFRKAISKH